MFSASEWNLPSVTDSQDLPEHTWNWTSASPSLCVSSSCLCVCVGHPNACSRLTCDVLLEFKHNNTVNMDEQRNDMTAIKCTRNNIKDKCSIHSFIKCDLFISHSVNYFMNVLFVYLFVCLFVLCQWIKRRKHAK